MKKFTIIGLAVCLAFALAAPVMAVDVGFSGDYRARGFYTSHWDLDETSASNAYMDMRFRLKTVFKVSDILSVTTRFDALEDKVWGVRDDINFVTGAYNDIDFDRAYMTIKAPIGTFLVGRMCIGTWGTSFLNTEVDRDLIKFVKKIDNLTLLAIFRKERENDNATGAAQTFSDDAADLDTDIYYLAGKYKMENVTAGVLGFFSNNKTVAAQARKEYGLVPYFVAKFGPLDIQGELRYDWGETERDPVLGVAQPDIDIKELAYNLEATYNFGPASVMLGYAFTSGDADAAAGNPDNEDSAYGNVGQDWEKLFIATYNETPVNVLGGVGNLSQNSNYGAKIIYGGASFSPLDNLTLGVVIGTAEADEIPAGMSQDDYGVEYDFTLNWKIYDNLTYSAIAAFLSAGDFWWNQPTVGLPAEPATFDDTYALFHQLELSF